MNLEALQQRLRDFDALSDNPDLPPNGRVQTTSVPGDPARYTDESCPGSLVQGLGDAVRHLGMTQLYKHQAGAFERIQ